MTTRNEQKEQRRQHILECALELFIRRGYSATKISDIASAAHMSAGLLFHYFESKEQLYLALMEMGVSGPRNMFSALEYSDPLDYFDKAAKQILYLLQNMPFVARMFVLVKQACYSDATPPSCQRFISQVDYYTLSVPIIEQGQKQGLIRPGDAYSLSVLFWTAIQGVAEVIALNDKVPCPQSEWIVDILRAK